MTATNAPSYPATLSAEQKAHEPSMDDILASIRRIISDDDALPLSRRARAAARIPAAPPAAAPKEPAAVIRPPAPPPAATSALSDSPRPPSDAFFGLGHRLGREADAPARHEGAAPADPPQAAAPKLARVASAAVEAPPAARRDETPAPSPSAEAPPPGAPKMPPLKLREFALRNFTARPTPASVVEPPAAEPVAPVPAAAPVEAESVPTEPLALRPSLVDAPAPVENARTSVVSLTPRLASFSDTRVKIAPLNFRTPVFRAPPRPAEPADEPVQAAAAPVVPVAEIRPVNPVEPEYSGSERVTAPERTAPERTAAVLAEALVAEVAPETAPPMAESSHAAPEPPQAAPARARAEGVDSGLLSPMTGAKINASFEALAESLMNRDPDLVERLAREMLRPMLKSWLDDNLPIVVERLVRAEIERVARGR